MNVPYLAIKQVLTAIYRSFNRFSLQSRIFLSTWDRSNLFDKMKIRSIIGTTKESVLAVQGDNQNEEQIVPDEGHHNGYRKTTSPDAPASPSDEIVSSVWSSVITKGVTSSEGTDTVCPRHDTPLSDATAPTLPPSSPSKSSSSVYSQQLNPAPVRDLEFQPIKDLERVHDWLHSIDVDSDLSTPYYTKGDQRDLDRRDPAIKRVHFEDSSDEDLSLPPRAIPIRKRSGMTISTYYSSEWEDEPVPHSPAPPPPDSGSIDSVFPRNSSASPTTPSPSPTSTVWLAGLHKFLDNRNVTIKHVDSHGNHVHLHNARAKAEAGRHIKPFKGTSHDLKGGQYGRVQENGEEWTDYTSSESSDCGAADNENGGNIDGSETMKISENSENSKNTKSEEIEEDEDDFNHKGDNNGDDDDDDDSSSNSSNSTHDSSASEKSVQYFIIEPQSMLTGFLLLTLLFIINEYANRLCGIFLGFVFMCYFIDWMIGMTFDRARD